MESTDKTDLERQTTMNYRELLKDKKRVVIKVGSSSLIHKETGRLDLRKLEVLVREISDLHNQGKDVVLVRFRRRCRGLCCPWSQ